MNDKGSSSEYTIQIESVSFQSHTLSLHGDITGKM